MSRWRALSYRKSSSIAASSLKRTVRRSISRIRCCAVRLATSRWFLTASNHARSSGDHSGTSCCSMAASHRWSLVASSRSVGILIVSSKCRLLTEALGSVTHGASIVSSSSALRHCLVNASAHHCASSTGASALTGSVAVGISAAASASPDVANWASHVYAARSVVGRLSHADASSFSS